MTSKTLLKLSFLKGFKEKFNLHESPVNAQTKKDLLIQPVGK